VEMALGGGDVGWRQCCIAAMAPLAGDGVALLASLHGGGGTAGCRRHYIVGGAAW
jgi:hypothetical protein